LSAEAVFGIWEAQREGDDDVLIKEKNITLNFLRLQIQKAAGQASLCLADFISDKLQDYIVAFTVTIKGIEPHLVRFEEELDDYHKIMLQALADRLAEACTELVHQKVRTEYWNYTDDEGLTN
jgi:5-methyltetrahydrofolate--homocysteine methyltransferase